MPQENAARLWQTPVGAGQAFFVVFCCWLSVVLSGLAMLAGGGLGVFLVLSRQGGGLSLALPPPLLFAFALELWDFCGRLPETRLLVLLTGYGAALVPLTVFALSSKPPLSGRFLFGPRARGPFAHVLAALLGTASMLCYQWLFVKLLSFLPGLGWPSRQTEILAAGRSEGWAAFVALGLSVSLLPLVEEVLFRGLLYRSLRKSSGPFLAALISSLSFGLWHFIPGRLWLVGQTTGQGLILAILYSLTGSLWAPILAHGLNNLMVFYLFSHG